MIEFQFENKLLNKFLSNLSYAFIAQIVSLALSVLMSLLLPKMLGITEFSYWQLFIFYGTYVGFFHFGLTDGVYLRYGGIHKDNLNKSLIGSQFWLLTFVQAIISTCVFVYSVFFIVDIDRKFVIILTAVYMIFANMTWYLGYVFQAINNTRLYSISIIIDKAFFIISIIILVFSKVDLSYNLFIILFMLGKLISLTFCIIMGKSIVFSKLLPFNETIRNAISNMKIGINLTLSSIASIMILGFGRLLVDKIWGITNFGIFSFSLSLTSFFLLFINQVGMVLFPALRQSNPIQLKQSYQFLGQNLSLLLPIILVVYIPIKKILNFWLPEYSESFMYLIMLLPLCIFDGKMQLLSSTYFKVLRQEKILLKINLSSMLLSIILSLIGAFIFKSYYFVIISMVVAVAFRSIISEIILSKFMKGKIKYQILSEIILIILFVTFAWNFSDILAFFLFLTCYLVYLLINIKKIKNIFITSKRLIKRV